MNIERAAMQSKLAGLKERQCQLRSKFQGLARSIRYRLNDELAPDIEDLRMDELSQIWAEMETVWGDLLMLRENIHRLELELS